METDVNNAVNNLNGIVIALDDFGVNLVVLTWAHAVCDPDEFEIPELELECFEPDTTGPNRVYTIMSPDDGPPIGDILRDALYKSKVPRYDQNLLRGVRRMAYQTLSVQSNPSAEEEARRFVQKYSSKGEESNVTRRPRGRPRKYP
ncbi:hypothetical protein OSTOST_24145 [Ostertagia ostertagi]